MAIRKIARMGHPILAKPAKPVADPTAPHIRALVDDMIETMHDAPGIGLAAPQIYVPLRVVIFYMPQHRVDAGEEAVPLTVLVNPVITPLSDEKIGQWEACLSVPDLRGLVPRWEHIRYGGYGLDGKWFEREARGKHAGVVQHECDHIEGQLYPQRMTNLADLVFQSEFKYRENPELAKAVLKEKA